MVLHSESITLSESERSLYEFILSKKNIIYSTFIYNRRRNPKGLYWRIWNV